MNLEQGEADKSQKAWEKGKSKGILFSAETGKKGRAFAELSGLEPARLFLVSHNEADEGREVSKKKGERRNKRKCDGGARNKPGTCD